MYLVIDAALSATDPEMSAGGGGRVCVKKGYFFSDKPLRHARPADFLSQTCPFLFRPLSVRDTFVYATYTLFSNYGINKACPPKADIKAE